MNIPQYDGNVTIESNLSKSENSDYRDYLFSYSCTNPQLIPVIITPRLPRTHQPDRVTEPGRVSDNNIVIKHSDKKV